MKKLFVILLLFSICSLCPGQEAGMLDGALLKKAGLSLSWQGSIALRGDEKISEMWKVDDKLFVLTNKNYFYSINDADGQIFFGIQIAPKGLPVYKPEMIGDELLMLAANKILVIDPVIGSIKGSYDPGFTSVCRPVKKDENLLMIGSDKRIHLVRYSDKLRLGNITADDGSSITSVIATDNSAFMATENGAVICFDIGLKRKYWHFDTEDAITADLVYNDGSVFASSEDTKLYNLSAADGSVNWIFMAGRPLSSSARIGDDVVYQFAKYKGLYGIDAASGDKLWVVGDGLDVLADKDGKGFVFTSNDTIDVMDNINKKKLYSINVTGVDNFVTNSPDNKIYLADGMGRVACLIIE